MLWTDEEIRELISLWPVASTTQIAGRLHRSRSAVCRTVARLRQEGVLPSDAEKHFEVTPRPARGRPVVRRMMPPRPPVNDRLDMRPCSLVELDETRCRWPLGDIYAVSTTFCGCVAVPGRHYCAHHLQRASSRHAHT
jgi:GcrA cell cycle regulator